VTARRYGYSACRHNGGVVPDWGVNESTSGTERRETRRLAEIVAALAEQRADEGRALTLPPDDLEPLDSGFWAQVDLELARQMALSEETLARRREPPEL
jgi:hypothetical protein